MKVKVINVKMITIKNVFFSFSSCYMKILNAYFELYIIIISFFFFSYIALLQIFIYNFH